jgi:hypothetical protein
MPHLLLFVPCQVAVIDQATNGLSVVNIIESIGMAQIPGPAGGFFIITWWSRHADEANAAMYQRIELRNETNVLYSQIETQFIFERAAHRVINQLPIFQINGPGRYEFRVFVGRQGRDLPDRPVAIFPVTIGRIGLPPVVQNGPAQVH